MRYWYWVSFTIQKILLPWPFLCVQTSFVRSAVAFVQRKTVNRVQSAFDESRSRNVVHGCCYSIQFLFIQDKIYSWFFKYSLQNIVRNLASSNAQYGESSVLNGRGVRHIRWHIAYYRARSSCPAQWGTAPFVYPSPYVLACRLLQLSVSRFQWVVVASHGCRSYKWVGFSEQMSHRRAGRSYQW
jgi:hypothetical protein